VLSAVLYPFFQLGEPPIQFIRASVAELTVKDPCLFNLLEPFALVLVNFACFSTDSSTMAVTGCLL